MRSKSSLKLVKPDTILRTVTPRRRPNSELRTREHLTESEVNKLITAAKGNRHGHRDATMILLTFRHGLRAAELVNLRWNQIDFGRNAALHVRRVKSGTPSTHPIQGDELRALRQLQREQDPPSSLRVRVTARRGVHHGWLCSHDGARGRGCGHRAE